MVDVEDSTVIKDAVCKAIYGENANHKDYTNEEVIIKLETDKTPDEIIFSFGENEDYSTEEIIAKLKTMD